MLIRDGLPASLALSAAVHGVPRFGVFAPFGCPPEEVVGWTMLIPWAVSLAGPTANKAVLVLAPTHPGFSFLLDRLGSHVVTTARFPPGVNAALQSRVAWLDANSLPAGFAEIVVALSASGGSETLDEARELGRRALAPDGVAVFGWRVPEGWEVTR